ncbi:MAG: hypothetical protein K2K19_06770 [Acetatifactor sp.]|nr:hypothetical protein [Acetatifactor sp.]
MVEIAEETIPAAITILATMMAAIRGLAVTQETMIPAETLVMARTWNGRTIISKRDYIMICQGE